MEIFSTFNPRIAHLGERKIYEYMKEHHPIGVNYLIFEGIINEFIAHAYMLFSNLIRDYLIAFNYDHTREFEIKEMAWKEVYKFIDNNINDYEYDETFDYYGEKELEEYFKQREEKEAKQKKDTQND